MVGRIFLVLILIAGGAGAYVLVPSYLAPKSAQSITVWLKGVLPQKVPLKEKVVEVAPAPTPPPPMPPAPESAPVKPEEIPDDPEAPIAEPVVAEPIVAEPEPEATKDPPAKFVKVSVAPPIPVNSYSNDLVTSIKGWQMEANFSGDVDEILIGDAEPVKLGTRPLTNDDVLQIKGWAGNVSLGMRMRHVVISMCKKIIGHAPVMYQLPDIAEKVHPNLVLSRWTAWIAVTHLPRCETTEIRFWALGAVAPVLNPILGGRRMDLPSDNSPSEKSFYTDGTPLMRENTPKPKSIILSIPGGEANLHNCADPRCRVIGTRAKGRHLAFIAGRAQDWALV